MLTEGGKNKEDHTVVFRKINLLDPCFLLLHALLVLLGVHFVFCQGNETLLCDWQEEP
jgi:hypothetical protein